MNSQNQKGIAPIAIILIIAGILVLGGGVYFWQKSKVSAPVATPDLSPTSTPSAATDQTADWKTYRNEEYGFEVKLPSEWTNYIVRKALIQQKYSSSAFYFSLPTEDKKFNNHYDVFEILIHSKDQFLALNENLPPGASKISGIGNSGKYVATALLCMYVCYNDESVGSATTLNPPKDIIISQKLFNQILSTFKFTK